MTDIPTCADIGLIQRAIPHRFPFLMIDRVRDIVPSKSAVGIKNVSINEPQFAGHFPGLPVLPGVLIVEALAQTSAVMVSLSLDLIDSGAVVYFMGIDKCRFRRKVEPGDVLELRVDALRGGGKVWKFKGLATVGDEVACECEFMAMIDREGAGA
ncbi:3-hydroxyacyl-[acyl-carrier-protein] dehydratase FabZ [Meridianimarinicoccus roseus]|jgi:3-hydroxyacyl-[acyl-carrier-protein] dehydratase|uniref:3-hydroxyacyl-[acyl-carrier-protein] dehydratase FabZ n=1 Tax=Meridianimarinicoccus roseus TaxID=2072018 RepID=A0A2V2LJJ8_9RHOB|nr:3-hydroxyacyl-ACP dehydratase FabZ [Meridianimarinicoccus roseus]PWR03317.1 3-hydroxyacyl-[acyl-carrier-protein] dehydratase FabZ [Meridianimarinicoccus roseus]